MTWTIIKITKIDDHQKLSAPIRVAKLFAKTATVFAAESVSLYGNEVNTHTHTSKRLLRGVPYSNKKCKKSIKVNNALND